MQHFPDSIALAAEPATLVERLILDYEEFAHLLEAQPRLAVLFSQRVLMLRGAPCAAVIFQPRWQGIPGMLAEFLIAQLVRPVLDGADPDYLIVVDAAIWDGLDAERRERLLFHELQHLVAQEDEFGVTRRSKKTGRPLLKLVPHDFEIFAAEILRYGVEICDIESLPHVIVEGEARKKRRNLRIA